MYTHTSKLFSTTTQTYNTQSQWCSEHGPCGPESPYVVEGYITCDGSSTVVRTLVYTSKSQRELHTAHTSNRIKSFTMLLLNESFN